MRKRLQLAKAIGQAAAGEADCERCPLRDGRLVPPEPVTKASRYRPIVVIGEAPGSNEIRKRRPFIGASGKLMMRGLERCGSLGRENVHWTNAVLCSTKHKGMPRDDLLAEAAKACENRLAAEIEQESRAILATAGNEALARIIDRNKPITRWRGTVSTLEELSINFPRTFLGPDQLLAPILHPAFVFRSPGWRKVFAGDVERLIRLSKLKHYTPPEDEPGRSLRVVRKEGTLIKELQALGPRVGFDVETDKAEPLDAELICFGLSDCERTIVIPWRNHWKNPARVAAIVSDALSMRATITQNGPAFDHVVGQQYGIHVRGWDDTILMAHALQSHLPKNLQSITTRYFDVPPWKELEDRKADDARLFRYNGRDTLYTALVGHEMLKEIE